MGSSEIRIPALELWYAEYQREQDASRILARVARHYTMATICRLVTSPRYQSRRAAVWVLGRIGTMVVNDVLGMALADEDRGVRSIADNSIRRLWKRGADGQQTQQMAAIDRLCESGNFLAALDLATELVHAAPALAEAWHQRAIAHRGIWQYEWAIDDCRQSLMRNRFHFAAAAGMGNCYLALDEPVPALESFRQALRINPSLESVRVMIGRLQRRVEG